MHQNCDSTSKIKAIETKYDGHKFRSRLEARWAVVFNHLGLIYEYEPEGFNLNTLGCYLPDFYLPHQKMWIETKPYIAPMPNIYMAGKISYNDWRQAFINIKEGDFFDTNESISITERFLNYVGPFFISCDHGCCHGKNEHGVGWGCGCGSERNEQDLQNSDGYDQFVVSTCLKNINRSQTVYAWIDSLDCYGTLLELGYAYANRKNIRVGVSEHLINKINLYTSENQHLSRKPVGSHDLWFLEKLANEFIFAPTAKQAFEQLYDKDTPEEVKKLKAISLLKSEPYVVIYGNPSHYIECGNTTFYSQLPSEAREKYADAIDVAGSYRFEHGENHV